MGKGSRLKKIRKEVSAPKAVDANEIYTYKGIKLLALEGSGEARVFIPATDYMRMIDGSDFFVPLRSDKCESPRFKVTDNTGDWYFTHKVTFHQVPVKMTGSGIQAAHAVMKTEISQNNAAAPSIIDEPVINDGTALVAELNFLFEDKEGKDFESMLRKGISIVADIQQAYHKVTKEVVGLMTMKSIPSILPTIVKRDGIWEEAPYCHEGSKKLTSNLGTVLGCPDSISESENESVLETFLGLELNMFGECLNIQREAKVAYESGNRINSIILIGLTAELFLKQMVKLMTWERGASVEEAASIFRHLKRSSWTTKLYSEMTANLGYDWRPESIPTLLKWRESVARPRNDAIHEGMSPSDDGLKASHDVFGLLQEEVITAVKNSGIFPITAHVWLGGAKQEDMINHSLRFTWWEREVELYNKDRPAGDVSNSATAVVIDTYSSFRSFLIDKTEGVAASIELGEELKEQVQERINNGSLEITEYPWTIHLSGHVYDGTDDLEWVPAYRVIPTMGLYPSIRTS